MRSLIVRWFVGSILHGVDPQANRKHIEMLHFSECTLTTIYDNDVFAVINK